MLTTPGASTEMGVHYLTWEAQTQPQSPPSLASVCASSQRPEARGWEGQPPLSPRALSRPHLCVIQALGEVGLVGSGSSQV